MKSWSSKQSSVFAFVSTGVGHGVVQARPGTGKTTVIVEAVNHIPAGKTILLCAFSKAISLELEARIGKRATVSTLHALGNKAFRGMQIDKHRIYKLLDSKLGTDKTLSELKSIVAKTVSLSKANLADSLEEIDSVIDDYQIDAGEGEDRKKVVELAQWCMSLGHNTGSIDFDDMVWLAVKRNSPYIKKFDFVLIDETQDLNKAQLALARMSCAKGGRILAVGDDKQSINGFAGADQRAIPRIIETLNATVMPLNTTYRCAKAIVRLAQQVCPDFEAGEDNPEGSVEYLSYAKLLEGAKPGDFVLSRSNAPLISACLSLIAEDRKACIAGRDIGSTLSSMIRKSKAKDIPAFLEWLGKWEEREVSRLESKSPARDSQVTSDKAKSLRVLCEGKNSIAEVIERIENLFSDEDNGNKVVFSSTHKAKGLERERVSMFGWTYLRGRKNKVTGEYEPPTEEEKNIWFVAVTRAKQALFIANTAPGKN